MCKPLVTFGIFPLLGLLSPYDAIAVLQFCWSVALPCMIVVCHCCWCTLPWLPFLPPRLLFCFLLSLCVRVPIVLLPCFSLCFLPMTSICSCSTLIRYWSDTACSSLVIWMAAWLSIAMTRCPCCSHLSICAPIAAPSSSALKTVCSSMDHMCLCVVIKPFLSPYIISMTFIIDVILTTSCNAINRLMRRRIYARAMNSRTRAPDRRLSYL
jgi:hypothetical protein